MNKVKKVVTSPFFAIGAFALAAVLLLSAGIGGASAALNDSSSIYELNIATQNIGVVVNENGEPVAEEILPLAQVPEAYQFDTDYPEELTVTNTGDIDEYVRVIVYKYWTDASGKKITYDAAKKLSPDSIDLNFVVGDGWDIHTDSSTDERTVLIYNSVLGSGKTTTPFADVISIDGDELASHVNTVTKVEPTADGKGYVTTSTTTFDLGEVNFNIAVEAQGVQTHNARNAMISAWGYAPDFVK